MFVHCILPRCIVSVLRGVLALGLLAACHLNLPRPATAQANFIPTGKETIVANVGDQAITRGEVDVLLRSALKGRSVGADALPVVQAQALSQAIDRRLIEGYLKREGQLVSEAEIDKEL